MGAEEKTSSGGGSGGKFGGSPFTNFIENNTKEKPSLYYNLGVYTILYNRIKNDLMNNNPVGDSTAFDTQINKIIKNGLNGSPDVVRDFLHKYELDNMVKIYDDPITDETKKDYYYDISSVAISKNLDNIIALARNLASVKYGAGKKQMLTIDDAREILTIKEDKSEKTQFEAARALTSFAGLDEKGQIKGGKLTQEWLQASAKLKGMKRNLNRGRWKALGWTALVAGGALLTGVVGFATLGLGAVGAGGLFGALYTTASGMGAIGGVAATGALGVGSWFGLKALVSRLGQNYKDRVKLKNFQHSRGKYAEAKEGEYDKMGYARVKDKYFAFTAIKYFFDGNKLQPDAKRFLHKDGTYDPEAYIPKKYRGAFKNYIQEQEQLVGHGMRDLKNMRNNINHHNFVAKRNIANDGKEFGFYGLKALMTHGVEGYETSDLTADEVVMNYGNSDPQNRLYSDRIREHKGYDSSLQYLMGNLKEVQNYEQKFKDAHMHNEYSKLMNMFAGNFSNAFNETLFENAYSVRSLEKAAAIAGTDEFKGMITSADAQDMQGHISGAIGFLTAERDNPFREVRILSEGIGVGVEHQIDMSEASLRKGCESLGVVTPETQAAASALAAMNSCSVKVEDDEIVRIPDISVINSINAVTDARTKNYLMHILQSKLISTKIVGDNYTSTLSPSDKIVADGLTSRIYAINSSSEAAEIRNNIASSSLGETEKAHLSYILDEQVNGLETKIRDGARVKAVAGIKKGSSKFSELVKAIDEIKSFKKEELHDLWVKIEKIEDQSLVEYLQLRFKDKVTHELMEYATNTAKFGGENIEAKLKTIKDFLLEASALCPKKGDKYIDEWQLQNCISALSSQVGITLSAYLDNLEKTFLTETNTKKEELTRLITQPIPVGLREFFDTNSPESSAILGRARRFTLSADVYNFMTVSSIGGYTGLVDADSADSKAALNIYFRKDRGSSDTLLGMLQRLNSDIDRTEINSKDPDIISAIPELDSAHPMESIIIGGQPIPFPHFAPPTGMGYKCNRIIRDSSGGYNLSVPASQIKGSFLYSTIETLKSPDFINSPADERLATLAILKKKITAMMRVQMIKLFEKKRGGATTYPDFVLANRSDLDANLITNWESVAMIIDQLIDNAKSNLSAGDQELYSSVSSDTVNAIRAICNLDEYQRRVNETRVFGA